MIPSFCRPGAAVPVVIAAALLTCLLVPRAKAQEPSPRDVPAKAVAVIHCDYPPVSFWNKSTNAPSGFFVDIMGIVAGRTGLKISYICENSWPEMQEAVESGKADLSVLMKSPERERHVLFSTPIEMTYLSFFARSQSSIDDNALSAGATVGAIRGSMSYEQLKNRTGIVVHPQESYQHGLFNLLAGKIDLFAGEEFTILRQARDSGLEDRIRKVGRPFREQERGIVVRRDEAALLGRLNSVLAPFIGSPEYQRIYLKWYGKPTSYWTVKRLLTAGGAVLFAAVCGMAYWRYRSVANLNRKLKRNIAERMRAEDVVQASEARLRRITDNMVDMIGQFDNTAVFQYASPSYERILGYRPEELVGRSALDLLHPDDRDDAIRSIGSMLHAGTGSVQFRYRHKDGTYRWIESTGRNIMDDRGAALGSILGSRDITERRHAEEALRTSEEMTRSVLDSVDEGFLVVGPDYRILNANRAYCSQVNVASDQVIGRRCYELSHNIHQPCHEAGEDCAVRRAFETGRLCAATHTHHDENGQALYVETRAFPLRNSAGEVTQVIESVSNITEKHLLEQERLKTQKLEAIGTLAGGIAHDFNNLLQGVFGFISLARLSCDDKQRGLNALEEAEKALHLAVNLTNQLLTFSKGGKPLKLPVNLRPTVDSAAKFALSGSRSVYRITGDDPWPAEADEGQIAQVIQNIVLNADQAMPEGGRIEIAMRNVEAPGGGLPQNLAPGKYVEIAVADTGIGIPAEHASRIFDPYFTTKAKGSGLGLATSYSIVRNHNGVIVMESEVGKGTIFSLYLPATGQACTAAPCAVTSGGPAVQQRGRVLLMDDDETIRSVAGHLIMALGHEVDFAARGEEALVKYRDAQDSGRPFSAVILDLTVRGGMGGAETLRKLSELDSRVKAIVSSGYSDDAITSNYHEHGFKAFLKKPYNVSRLQAVLNSVIVSS